MFSSFSEDEFNEKSLEVFRFQAKFNAVYGKFLEHLRVEPNRISKVDDIPFLPIELFKSHKIVVGENHPNTLVFSSSGTSGMTPSKHFVAKPDLYHKSFLKAFERFYGSPEDYRILALLPSYLEREGSSLIYMVNSLIEKSKHRASGFFLDNRNKLRKLLSEPTDRKTLLIGVSFALLDLVEEEPIDLKNTIVMETGGMKGRRKEITRKELHRTLCKGFGVEAIHSEYGMTELLSQAYSKGHAHFRCPPWMKILIRDAQDPFSKVSNGKSGGINVIDLANLYSCSFIATSDLGKLHQDGTFEVLGRMDYSDMRGCNLMVV